jgi:hypothetical protein
MNDALKEMYESQPVTYEKSDFRIVLQNHMLTSTTVEAITLFVKLCLREPRISKRILSKYVDSTDSNTREVALLIIRMRQPINHRPTHRHTLRPFKRSVNKASLKDSEEFLSLNIDLVSEIISVPTETIKLFSITPSSKADESELEHMIADRDLAIRRLILNNKYGIHRTFMSKYSLLKQRHDLGRMNFGSSDRISQFYDVYYIHYLLLDEGVYVDQFASAHHKTHPLIKKLDILMGRDNRNEKDHSFA